MSRCSSGRGSFGGGIRLPRSLRTAFSSVSACCGEVLGLDLREIEPAREVGGVVAVAAVLIDERPLLRGLGLAVLATELSAARERERREQRRGRRDS